MMDAIEMAIKNEEINTFAIIASDNGYHTLALRLRELGKKVIGIGAKDKCNPIWVKSCNEFIYFEDLEEKDEEILLNEANKNNDINLQDFSLEKFVEKVENKDSNKRLTGTIKRRIQNYRIISADNGSGDFFFYMGEINPQFKGNILEKETKVDFLVVNRPDDNGGFDNKNGRATDVKVIE